MTSLIPITEVIIDSRMTATLTDNTQAIITVLMANITMIQLLLLINMMKYLETITVLGMQATMMELSTGTTMETMEPTTMDLVEPCTTDKLESTTMS